MANIVAILRRTEASTLLSTAKLTWSRRVTAACRRRTESATPQNAAKENVLRIERARRAPAAGSFLSQGYGSLLFSILFSFSFSFLLS